MSDNIVDVIIEVAPEGLPEEVASLLTTAVNATLAYEQTQAPVELSLLLTDDEHIRQLNRDFRQEDKATDVLSFPTGEEGLQMGAAAPYLGDIAISVPYAARQAAQAEHDLAGELQLLAVHGVLHLLGYDHLDPDEKEEMWAAQTAVLAALNLSHVTPTTS
jgi:probable rRNA maturation factor